MIKTGAQTFRELNIWVKFSYAEQLAQIHLRTLAACNDDSGYTLTACNDDNGNTLTACNDDNGNTLTACNEDNGFTLAACNEFS